MKSIKNLNDPIGNRTRDLPTCSVVPQPTAPSPTSTYIVGNLEWYDPVNYEGWNFNSDNYLFTTDTK